MPLFGWFFFLFHIAFAVNKYKFRIKPNEFVFLLLTTVSLQMMLSRVCAEFCRDRHDSQSQAPLFDLQGPCTEADTLEPRWAADCAKWSWHQRRAVQGRYSPPWRDHRWRPKWEWPIPTATWTSWSARTVSDKQLYTRCGLYQSGWVTGGTRVHVHLPARGLCLLLLSAGVLQLPPPVQGHAFEG